MTDAWELTLAVTLVVNAAVGLAYPVYRLSKGGPMGDVRGRAVLGALLLLLAASLFFSEWTRWVAFGYGLLFAMVVMPIWVLAVLLPLRPGPLDYAFTIVYWGTHILIVVSALLAG